MCVIITNKGLSKKVDISNYKKKDILKLIDTYVNCNYDLKFGH
jgi:hypothetical protein